MIIHLKPEEEAKSLSLLVLQNVELTEETEYKEEHFIAQLKEMYLRFLNTTGCAKGKNDT